MTDEEEAYIVTAKMFALGAYGLLKDKAARSRELVKNYKPVFENSAKYAEFMISLIRKKYWNNLSFRKM